MKKQILGLMMALVMLSGCAGTTPSGADSNPVVSSSAVAEDTGLRSEGKMELKYAKNFQVEYFEGGYKMLTVLDENPLFIIPEGKEKPEGVPENAVIVKQPLDKLLVSSTPTTSLFYSLGILDKIALTTTDKAGWQIDAVVQQMEEGKLTFVGDYKDPDYEKIVASTPPLAIFSNMLSKAPKTVEKFAELNIPILADQAASESHPLARVEWMKLYAALFNMEEKAEELLKEQEDFVATINTENTPDETAAIFYITSKNQLYARNGGDYVAEMFNMAGGNYIFNHLNPDQSGTTNMEFEEFYATAKDADHIIYIWNLGGKPQTLADFMEKNALFSDFKAVQNGNVWCTTPDFFQISNTLGYMIKDMNNMLNLEDGSDEELTYLFRLK